MAEANQAELNKFVKVIDEFKVKYARLILPATRAAVYASKNSQMISDYESSVKKGAALNATIRNLVGVWDAAKRGWSSVTDQTSMVIGDAVDWVRGLFGYQATGGIAGGLSASGLGAVQLAAIPAAVAMAGIVGTALVLIAGMNRIFVSIEATKIQRENPNVSRAVAIQQAKDGLPSFLPGGLSLPMWIAAGAALYYVMSR